MQQPIGKRDLVEGSSFAVRGTVRDWHDEGAFPSVIAPADPIIYLSLKLRVLAFVLVALTCVQIKALVPAAFICLLYTSDAADE